MHIRRSRGARLAGLAAGVALLGTTVGATAGTAGAAHVVSPKVTARRAVPAGAEPAAKLFTTSLKGICPNPLIVQTNWLPEADHAALYELIGAGGTMKQYSYEGPLGSTGIKLQILSGGPGDAFLPTQATLYAGNPVVRVTPQLVMDTVEKTLQFSKKFPTVAVVNLQNHDPQMLMYDPSRWKHLGTIADLAAAAKAGAHLYVSGLTYPYVQYLIEHGVPAGAFIGGYSGDLEKFVTGGGMVLNQGYSDAEPYLLAHDTPAWGGKPVKYVYISQYGLNDYPTAIQVRRDKLASLSRCLTKLVPMLQQSIVDYFAHPQTVNEVLAKFNPKYSASYWTTPVAESVYSDKVQLAQKIVANSSSGSVGAFNMARLAETDRQLFPIMAKESPGTYVPGIPASQLATNKFIDPSIHLP